MENPKVKNGKITLYIAYIKDKFELPIYVADSIKELATKFNSDYKHVLNSCTYPEAYNRPGSIAFRKVIMNEKEFFGD